MSLKSVMVLGASVVALLFTTSCATRIHLSKVSNPPPSEAFNKFTSYMLEPITLAPAYANNGANKKALAKIQERFSTHMLPTVTVWNQEGASREGDTRTLVFTPVVKEIKFIGGAARFWVGALAGSSAVLTQVTITEKESGKTIDTPEFYASANAHVGAMALGVTDNLMLDQIAEKMAAYIKMNYAAAVGGATGGH